MSVYANKETKQSTYLAVGQTGRDSLESHPVACGGKLQLQQLLTTGMQADTTHRPLIWARFGKLRGSACACRSKRMTHSEELRGALKTTRWDAQKLTQKNNYLFICQRVYKSAR